MLSDRDALFAAICANPEEDTPRLMYADWLDEQGNEASAARAEFIRLQCALARLAEDESDSQPLYEFLRDRDYVTRPSADWMQIDEGIHRRIALTVRAEDLFNRHGEAWIPKLPKKYRVEWVRERRHSYSRRFDLGWESSFLHRGFPHRVSFGNGRVFGELAPRLRAAVPAVTLVAEDFPSQFVDQLADVGLLGWIVGLELQGGRETGLRAFGHRPEASRVRAITIQYGNADDAVAALAEAPHWTGLRDLDLSDASISPEAAEELFRSNNLRTLRRLHLRGIDNWALGAVRALAAGGFSELRSLRLTACGLNDEAAEVLANCPALGRLRELDLGHNQLTGRGITALLASPHLANVAFLGLENNLARGLDARRLAEAAPGRLRMFHAHGCRFRTADVRALARCPRLSTLWYLDLDDNQIGTPAVRELVRGFGKRCPPILWLTHNRIDDRGAAVLAKWKAASALRVLHLRYNATTDAGVRALLDSPHLASLDGLGVSGASDETNGRMKERFRYHNIGY